MFYNILVHRENYPSTLFLNWEHSFLKLCEYILVPILEQNGDS